MKPVRILIFAKVPLPGFAKTRLIPALGKQGAADLAQRMLMHTLREAVTAGVGPVELCVTPPHADAAWRFLNAPAEVQWSDQGEGDLGARMARAAQRTIDAGESVLLIGTDCPEMDATRLRQAANALWHADASMYPTADGGYALLGLNRFHPALFQGIAWSTSTVAFSTLSRIARLGWVVRNLQALHDIDEPADLKWLPEAWGEPVKSATRRKVMCRVDPRQPVPSLAEPTLDHGRT